MDHLGLNILAFGLPGQGKTHVACAIGHEIVRRGRRVLFVPTYQLVQRLLVAKRDLTLERELRHLDRFDAAILDDLGYVQQDRSEMEVLFTFLAERYERKSVIITSNLVFSKWNTPWGDAHGPRHDYDGPVATPTGSPGPAATDAFVVP